MMNANSKRAAAASFITLVLLGTSACSSPINPGPAPSDSKPAATAPTPAAPAASASSAPSGQPKVIKVYTGAAPNETTKESRKKTIEAFEAKNPGYKIQWLEGDNQVEGGKLSTMLNSGVEVPDVINISTGPGRIQALASANLIMPLDQLYEQNKWKDKLNPGAVDFMKYNADKIYEVPNTVDAIQVYYNKEIFNRLGLQVPKTSDEFGDVLKKIKASGMTPIALGARNGYAIGWLFGNILQAVAGRAKTADILNDKAPWNDPDAVKAASLFGDWVKAGYIDKEAATIDDPGAKARFLDAKHAMIFIGAWFHVEIVDKKMQDIVGMFPLPSFKPGETPYPTGGLGNSWVVPSQVKDVSLAAKWLDFVLSKEYAAVTASNPAADSIIPSKAASEAKPVSKLLEQSIQSISGGSGYNPSVFMGAEAKDAYYQNLTGIIGGLVAPQKAMDNIEAADAKERKAAK
ncbi:ABC transporter substrate-binding protein [Paenibacillus cremeus]|uniref:Extracellular solute-binding protein n=1 Tax=Paenibacillus cremeus TaxID=2163881 RepID=A0A559KE90_9BACL|nr:extracellular solute-binding protein [Paenibacillus cremeus]TVY10446.1 extracellular solute-binding protein [Paenibacillus cremeus]